MVTSGRVIDESMNAVRAGANLELNCPFPSKYQFCVSKKTPVPVMFDGKSFISPPLGGMWLQIKKRLK
jgi:hypothetical protein